MKKIRNSIFYILVVGGFTALIYWLIVLGTRLEDGRNVVAPRSLKGQWENFLESIKTNLEHPLALLLAQIVTIILVAKLFGWICKKIGQPSVVGEMIAGIVLGPSLFGMYLPELSGIIFPKQSLGNLQFLSQIGLILFMFIVGMELDLKMLRNKTHDAVVISHASIVVPFALGIGLAYFIYQAYAPDGVQFLSFGLFMGIAMSITAFPVLARIVQERGLTKTRLGTIVITCAAADDITAWCILAAVIAIVKAGSFVSSIYTILLALAYVFFMIKFVRPFLAKLGSVHSSKETLTRPVVAVFFLTLMLSAYATEVIGIHALFGAFMAGAVMPENNKFRNVFIEKVEDVALVLLLPLFFVFTGLRTQIGLLDDPELWKLTGSIILVAVVGKFIGSALAAKFVGQNWKDSLSIGALMNTRGLMELVVLNIGYDLGVLTPEVFAMMVIMALITTFMTGPALNFINWFFKKRYKIKKEQRQEATYSVLLSFDDPESGKALIKLADGFTTNADGKAQITAMHVSAVNQLHIYDMEEYEKDRFGPVLAASADLGREIKMLFKASADINNDIAAIANKGAYDLLLISMRESIYEGSLIGRLLGFTNRFINPEKLLGTVTGKERLFEHAAFDEHSDEIMSKAQVPVGVFIDKKFRSVKNVLVAVIDEKDGWLLHYAQRLLRNTSVKVVIIDEKGYLEKDAAARNILDNLMLSAPDRIALHSRETISNDFSENLDLLLISVAGWKEMIDAKTSWIEELPSMLILSDESEND